MRYAQIRKIDISNGEGVGVSLFVQGCPIHCPNCFNKETWDFDGGKEWTDEIDSFFFSLIQKDYIQRVTILGGEPLSPPNVSKVKEILSKIPSTKKKWLYTGYSFEGLNEQQLEAVKYADYLVDGAYIDKLRDMKLEFRGSSNQRIIDVKKTLKKNKVVLK